MSTKCPTGQIQHRMPTLGKCGNAREPCDKAGFTKTKRPTGPHRTGKSTAALLTCPLHECQFFEKAYQSIVCEMGVLICRLQSRPGLGAALFTRSMAQYSRVGWPKVNLLGNFREFQPGTWSLDLKKSS